MTDDLLFSHGGRRVEVSRVFAGMPGLSRRLNRIITNCGRAAFKAKLADLKERFGIEVAQINPAYTSQECEPCGFRGQAQPQIPIRIPLPALRACGARWIGLSLRITRTSPWRASQDAERHPPGTQASSGQPWKFASRGNEAFVVGTVTHGAYHECQ